MYHIHNNGVEMGDGSAIPTTFRATDGISPLEFLRLVYQVLERINFSKIDSTKEIESNEALLQAFKDMGLLTNYNSSEEGFVEFPLSSQNNSDLYRIDFSQTLLYQDALVLLNAIGM